MEDWFDLRQQHRDWMQQLIPTGMVTITPPAQIWYTQNASRLGEPKQISLTHHAGGVVVMRAALASGQANGRFVGANPAMIRDCKMDE